MGCLEDGDEAVEVVFHSRLSGFRVEDAGFRVQGARCRVWISGSRMQGAGCRVQHCLEDGDEAVEVVFDVLLRVVQRVPHTGLQKRLRPFVKGHPTGGASNIKHRRVQNNILVTS